MFKNIIPWLIRLIIFLLLTLVTQIGGVVYLLCLPIFNFAKKLDLPLAWSRVLRVFIFLLLYSLATFYIVPPLALSNERVPMPLGDENSVLRPHTFLTVFLNRHYVVTNLRSMIESAAQKTAKTYPGTITEYLECGFPFGDYAMPPHIAHAEGRKIDIAFFYFEPETKQRTNERPSLLGYGASEEPKPGEIDEPTYCAQKGFWRYSFMHTITFKNNNLAFDAPRTRDFIKYLLSDNRLQSILIEPHLESRLNLQKDLKIKTPPCNSVRHDDHLHVAIY